MFITTSRTKKCTDFRIIYIIYMCTCFSCMEWFWILDVLEGDYGNLLAKDIFYQVVVEIEDAFQLFAQF